MTATADSRTARRIAVHILRASLFVLAIVLIHLKHKQRLTAISGQPLPPVAAEDLQGFFPDLDSIAVESDSRGRRQVFDATGESLGFILQTSPQSDHIIGFSGPTNTLVAFGPDDRILGIRILSSGDTRDHVAEVRDDKTFLNSLTGKTWDEAATNADVDGVTGATLTSFAIQEAIIHRLGGRLPSLRFPDALTIQDVGGLFADADSVEQDVDHAALWHVVDRNEAEAGTVLRTSPAADNVIGYQGPTEALIGFGPDGRVIGISIGKTYDNEQYVTYVRDDEYFLTLFNNLVLEELASLNLAEAGVEGVSGATMTSMAVAEGLVLAAHERRQALAAPKQPARQPFAWMMRDLGTGAVILLGLVIGLTSLRSKRPLRLAFLLLLIVYLGVINGDMLSQAMIVGWAQSGVPWRTAGGLTLLTIAAFAVPLTTRRNIYCSHLCPHGAAQQLLKRRLPWQFRMPKRLSQSLRIVPVLLLAWCIVVAMAALPFSLVDIEPFDAWVYYVAGWATITIAVVGLIASLFVPMAYCRYGCPTGALLNFLRFNSRSDHWSRRDWVAVGLVLLAGGLLVA